MEAASGRGDRGGGGDGAHPPNFKPPPACVRLAEHQAELKRRLEETEQNVAASEATAATAAQAAARADADARKARDARAAAAAEVAAAEAKARNRPEPAQIKAPPLLPAQEGAHGGAPAEGHSAHCFLDFV